MADFADTDGQARIPQGTPGYGTSGRHAGHAAHAGSSRDASSHSTGRRTGTPRRGSGPHRPASPAGKWGLFIAVAAALSLITALVVPRLVPSAQTMLSGGVTPTGSLRLGLADAPDGLDIRTRTNEAAARLLMPNVYEGLTGRDSSNKPVPALASSWTVSKDAKTYTFHLRQASFSDGSAFSATDVLDSFHTATVKKLPGSSIFSAIRSMNAPDSRTVVIRLSHPDPQLLWHLSTAPAAVYRQGTAATALTKGSLPAGTGAFTASGLRTPSNGGCTSADVTACLTLTANTGWWKGTHDASPRVKTISVRWYADTAHLGKALSSGAVQAAVGLGPDEEPSVNRTKYTVTTGQSTAQLLVTFNSNDNSLLSDRLLREAHTRILSTSLAKQAYGDQAEENAWPVASLDPGYQKSDSDLGDFSQQKFDWLISVYSRRVTMAVSPEVPQKLVDALTAAERQAGFSFTATRLTAQQWKEQVTSASADRPLGYDMALWVKHGSHDLGDWMTGSNWWDYDSSDADQQYNKAITASNDADFEAGLRQAAKTLLDGHPASWLLQPRTITAWKSSLALTGLPSAMTDIYLPLSDVRLG
jgi:peptide/nickel transport system substrate-binding protein